MWAEMNSFNNANNSNMSKYHIKTYQPNTGKQGCFVGSQHYAANFQFLQLYSLQFILQCIGTGFGPVVAAGVLSWEARKG